MEIESLSIVQLKEGLERKSFSAREITEHYLREIKEKDNDIQSFLFVDEEGALAAAGSADESIAKGESHGALSGIPLAVKDNILVKNLPATSASKILESYTAAYDATVVSRLKKAGAVILGKTNMDEFAMGASTENSAFRKTKNPRDWERVPGGSSGGSAAAVAGGLTPLALGSDTGGSIRQPAAFTGVVGLKPTYGRVSRHGLMAMASSLDQIGPLAKSVEDAAVLFSAIAGHDRYDATSSALPVKPMAATPLVGVKIGVPKEYFAEGLDPRIRDAVERALRQFEKEGARIKEISLPHASYALPAYYIIVPAEVSANMARYDGLRYGFHAERSKNIIDTYKNTRDQGLGTEVKRRIMVGTYVLSHGYYDAYYLKAQKARRAVRNDFINAFGEVDVIMGPTTPSIAFKIGAKMNDPVSMYLEDIYTVSVNLSGVPAISIPCGNIEEEGKKLPVGLQIIGQWFDEPRLLGIAKECENNLRNT